MGLIMGVVGVSVDRCGVGKTAMLTSGDFMPGAYAQHAQPMLGQW